MYRVVVFSAVIVAMSFQTKANTIQSEMNHTKVKSIVLKVIEHELNKKHQDLVHQLLLEISTNYKSNHHIKTANQALFQSALFSNQGSSAL